MRVGPGSSPRKLRRREAQRHGSVDPSLAATSGARPGGGLQVRPGCAPFVSLASLLSALCWLRLARYCHCKQADTNGPTPFLVGVEIVVDVLTTAVPSVSYGERSTQLILLIIVGPVPNTGPQKQRVRRAYDSLVSQPSPDVHEIPFT